MVILDLRNATNHVKIQSSLMSTYQIVIIVITRKNTPKLVLVFAKAGVHMIQQNYRDHVVIYVRMQKNVPIQISVIIPNQINFVIPLNS